MSNTSFVILECQNPDCRLRYPTPSDEYNAYCSRCGCPIKEISFNNAHLIGNTGKIENVNCIHALLDNIRSTYNVGAMIRTAEGFGINHLVLGGYTSTPLNKKINKTSLGAEQNLSWEYCANSVDHVMNKYKRNFLIIGLENCQNAKPIWEFDNELKKEKLLLIVGNEQVGIDPDLLSLCDQTLYIPMLGQKHSFNVTTAFGIALFFLQNRNSLN